jgi:phage shock protein A
MGNKLGWVVGIVVLGIAAYLLFPGIKAKVDKSYDKHFGWNAEARRKDPVGFMEYSIGKLGENIGKFEQARGDLRVAQLKLEDMKRDNSSKLAFADKQLVEFKDAYKAATGGKGWPVAMAGRNYTEGELKSQVTMLLSQRGSFEKVVKQIDVSISAADKKSLELVNRISESKSKLSILETQKELVKVGQVTAESEKILSEVNDVLIANEAMAEKASVRTVEELMRDAGESAGSVSNPDTEAFLNS